MERVVLNNGYSIPAMGYGTYALFDELNEALPAAVRAGCRMIDTSDNYGNERNVGEAFRKLTKFERDETVIISKFSHPLRTRYLKRCLNESASNIDEDHGVDVYLMHWPYPYLWKEIWKRMENLYEEGKCKAIGVCNFEKENLEELLSICRIKPAINQFECHPLFIQKEIVNCCRENDIAVMSYSPLARMEKDLVDSPVIKTLAEKYGKTPAQIIIRWNIDNRFIPIPSSSKEKNIISNFDVEDFSLEESEIKELDSLDCGRRIRYDPKTRFDKKAIRKFHMYSTWLKFLR